MLERPAIDSGLGRRSLNESWSVVKCTYLLLSGGRTGPDGQATNSHHESLPATCWMRCLQRCATSSGTVGAGNPTAALGNTLQRLGILTIGKLFLTFNYNFLYFHSCLWPLALSGHLCFPSRPPKNTQSTPFPGRNLPGKSQRWSLLPFSAVRRMGPLQRARKHKVPSHRSLIIVIIPCCHVQNIISTQT